MGAAARKYVENRRVPAERPGLRLVPPAPARPARKRRTASDARAKALFRICCVGMVALALVGLVRVAVAVQAEEAAIDAVKIKQDIKAEELVVKSLEADASALKAPSRIAAIADSALNMTEAGKVAYIALPEGESAGAATDAVAKAGKAAAGGIGAVISSVMDVAAGEAQVLLVGDVGLSAR